MLGKGTSWLGVGTVGKELQGERGGWVLYSMDVIGDGGLYTAFEEVGSPIQGWVVCAWKS
eukprot:765148-Hanusia_phi.AAC.5